MDNLKSDRVEAMNPIGSVAIQAAQLLIGAFCWEDSAEGYEYWQRIYDRLHYIASLDKDFTYGGGDE